MAASLPFRPFEYMHWAKHVAPGAPFPMHVSGLPAPAPLPFAVDLSSRRVFEPPAAAREAFTERLLPYIGALGSALLPVSGASEGVFVALAALVERGSAVLVEQPAYRAMERVVQFLGGVPVRVPRVEDDGWRLDPAHVTAALRESGAGVLAITDPHNPTGASISLPERAALIAAVERAGAFLVVDEIFAPFRGAGAAPAWAAQSKRVLSIGSLTKGWGLSALRCGWVAGAPDLVHRGAAVFDLLGVNAPPATLYLAASALGHAAELDARACAAAAALRAALAATDWGAAELTPPDTGITAFLQLPAGLSSGAVATSLREQDGVQVVPGHFFGSDRHLRIGGVAEGCDLTEGCRRIAARLNAPVR